MNHTQINKINDISKDVDLIYTRPLREKYFTDTLYEAYILGYNDAIDARLDNHNYCKATDVKFLEEVIYLYGYKMGTCDYNLEVINNKSMKFDDTYKEIIKMILMISDLGEMIRQAEITLTRSKMI